MSRYIDENDVYKLVEPNGVARVHCSQIDELPRADVVEVVRCRDCKWWTKQSDSAQGRCALSGHYPTGYWYCANGERSENDNG